MSRRIITILILLTTLGATAWIFLQFKKITEQAPNAINYIPSHATTVIKLQDSPWTTFYTQAEALTQLLDSEYQLLRNSLSAIDSLRSQQEGVQELLDLGDKYLSFFDNNPKGSDWIYSMGLLSTHDQLFFQNLFPNTTFKVNQERGILWFAGKDFNWMIVNQILFVSPNAELLKLCIPGERMYPTVVQDSIFSKVIESTGLTNIQVFARTPQNAFNLVDERSNKWSSHEISVKNNKLDLFGFTFETTINASQSGSTIRVPLQLISNNGIDLEAVSIQDIEQTLKQIEEKITFGNRLNEYTNQLVAIENNCQCEAKQLAFNRTHSYGTFQSNKHGFVYIHYPNFNEAISEYQPLINDNFSEEKAGYNIHNILYSNLYSTLLDQPKLNHIKYFIFKDDYLIFSPKIESLHWLINEWQNQRTLDNDPDFDSYISRVHTKATWLHYEKSKTKRHLFYPFHSKSKAIVWQKENFVNGVYNHVTLPIVAGKPKVNNINPIATNQTGTSNSSVADTTPQNTLQLSGNAITTPSIVTNHYTQEKEIFIQDDKNIIYLINHKNEKLWDKQISGKIESPVRQIDVYRNGKLQLVFNTANKIYCLDRNGKNVDGFPINLKSKATSPLAVFDYDKKKKYRLVIGCEDNDIYNYTVEAKNTIGWKYKATDSPVIALEHIQIKGKDYIFSLTADNSISILKRTGAKKFSSDAIATAYNKQGYALDYASSIEKTRMLYINTTGELVGLSFDNSKQEVLKKGFSADSQFTFADIDGDKKSDILISDNRTLKTYSSNLKEIYSKTTSSRITHAPVVYRINNQDLRTGVTTSQGEFILLNASGQTIEGYPIPGTNAIKIVDLNNDGVTNSIIVNSTYVTIK